MLQPQRALAAGLAAVLSFAPLASAQFGTPPASRSIASERVSYTFEHDGLKPPDQGGLPIAYPEQVYVVGSIPELGDWDVTKAVKLARRNDSTWATTIAMPAGRSFEYRYIVRDVRAGKGADPDNAIDLGGVHSASVPGSGESPRFVWARLSMADPVVHWVMPDGTERSDPMLTRSKEADGRSVFFHPAAGLADAGSGFWIEDAATGERMPHSGSFETPLRRLWVQGGEVFAYEPASSVSAPRTETFSFSAAEPDEAYSFNRTIRVNLPRGYDEHTDRNYPVLYFHDGRFVMEDGTNRSWRADEATADGAAGGLTREAIIVAIDQGDRQADYLDPSIMGQGQNYLAFITDHLKPHIDTTYRTLTGPDHTASIGASFGGVAAVYHVLARPDVIGLGGSFSPSFWATTIDNAIQFKAMGDVRVYLDSGDAGNAADGYENTFAVRDRLLLRDEAPNVLGENVHHVVGYGHTHHESKWAQRLPGALRYLIPAHEQTGPFPAMCAAGYAPPENITNFMDILAYLDLYMAGDPAADLADPFNGFADVSDLIMFFNQFSNGCQ